MELEHRIIKLELRVDDHSEELEKLQDISSDLRRSLAGIEKTLAQIKWIATGVILVILAQAMGVPAVLRLMI
jgi:hypothetical protein